MIDVNPAKVGVENPTRRRKEQHPFETWDELEALAAVIGPRYGPMILFAAATGLRPAEWIALEKRDVDRTERVVYVRRSFTRAELKFPKTEASMRAVPLQARAVDALDRIKDRNGSPLLFPGQRGGAGAVRSRVKSNRPRSAAASRAAARAAPPAASSGPPQAQPRTRLAPRRRSYSSRITVR